MPEREMVSEGAADDGPLDVSGMSLEEIDRIDRPVLAEELRRLLDDQAGGECAYGGFQAIV